MTPTIARAGHSPQTQESPRSSSFPTFKDSTWSQYRHKVNRLFYTERAVGFILGAVLVVWGGWLLWALSRALENYRVF